MRITDESGQHIQHMDPPNSFLFSSLFDGDMVVGGSHPDSAEALLSSLRSEELCRGLVDDLVSRTSGKESGWKVDFHGDWSLFSSSGDTSPQWSSEDDQNQTELDCEDSRALWESLSSCSDPYNPLFFSASFSTSSRSVETEPDKVLVSRSDSEVSWSGSDSSGLNEESEKLLEFFNSADPYNPMCFTASVSSTVQQQSHTREGTRMEVLRPFADEEEDEEDEDEEEGEEEQFEQQHDGEEEEDLPWNPLYLHNATPANTPLKNCVNSQGKNLYDRKPRPTKAKSQHHSHSRQTRVPWKKPRAEESKGSASSPQKQVSRHLL